MAQRYLAPDRNREGGKKYLSHVRNFKDEKEVERLHLTTKKIIIKKQQRCCATYYSHLAKEW